MKYLIISKTTLSEALGTIVNPVNWTPLPADEVLQKRALLVFRQANFIHIVSLKDIEAESSMPLIVNLSAIEAQPQRTHYALFTRIDKSAEILKSQANALPANWRPYHAGNKVTFFAHPHESSARWIVEFQTQPRNYIFFRDITNAATQVNLDTLQSDVATPASAFRSMESAAAEFRAEIQKSLTKFGGVAAQGVTLLNDIGAKIVAQNRPFEAWLKELTIVQKMFVDDAKKEPLSIYGPAGSGKTLSLALYAISQCRKEASDFRVCFLTQNWSQAYMIDSLVQSLSGHSGTNIYVYPMLYVVRSLFDEVRPTNPDYQLLIEDSIEGKRQNFIFVREAIEDAAKHDFAVIKPQMSSAMRERIEEAADDQSCLNQLAWDVMNEFASVLSVNRIRPGITAGTRYRHLPRANWMMPLETDADKDFVLAAYNRYIRKLDTAKIVSYDQLLSDYISKFDTFEWDRRRVAEGYNIIVIDEFHLFTDIERSIIPYLYRSVESYPRLVMASDPMQSPTDSLKGIEFAKEHASLPAASINGRKFEVFKRYSREIEAFVTHVYNSYPTLLQNDKILIDGFSKATPSHIPSIAIHSSRAEAIKAITREVDSKDQQGIATRAVICLGYDELLELESHWKRAEVSAIFIKDQSDINLMKYSSKRVVATYAEMTAGLQFNEVSILICGWGEPTKGSASLFSNRVNITRLYIAASRATTSLGIHFVADTGDLPAVLRSALDKKLLLTT